MADSSQEKLPLLTITSTICLLVVIVSIFHKKLLQNIQIPPEYPKVFYVVNESYCDMRGTQSTHELGTLVSTITKMFGLCTSKNSLRWLIKLSEPALRAFQNSIDLSIKKNN